MNRYGKDYWTRPSSGFLKVETEMAPFTVEDITKLDRDWMPTTNEYLSAEELAARDFYLAEKKETIEYELEAQKLQVEDQLRAEMVLTELQIKQQVD